MGFGAGRAFDRKRNVDNARKGFRQRSRAELLSRGRGRRSSRSSSERLAALATGWHLVGVDRQVIDVDFTPSKCARIVSRALRPPGCAVSLGLCGERGKFYEELVESLIAFRRVRIQEWSTQPRRGTEGDHKASAAKQWEPLAGRSRPTVDDHDPAAVSRLSFPISGPGTASTPLVLRSTAWRPCGDMGRRDSWCALMGIDLEPWEALTMIRLGHLRANIESEKINKAAKAK
jgi:hypothetical protein